VLDQDKAKVGRAFSAAVVETGLASYPGFYSLAPPADASMYGVYWPTTVPAGQVTSRVLIDGREVWTGPARVKPSDESRPARGAPGATASAGSVAGAATGPTKEAPLGLVAGARSGDKGGNANVGIWVRTDDEFSWLDDYLTAERLAALVPAVAGFAIERHRLPNLRALNFVIVGLLGRGVAASTRLDPQAKALGEEVRAAVADIPAQFLA
jgi:hypothetical protein